MNIKKLHILVIMIISIGIQSCGDGFYTRTTREDLYRLPLVKPYELINPSSERQIWAITLKTKADNVYSYNILITEIQFQNGIIFGRSPNGEGNQGEEHLIIDLSNDKEYVFSNDSLWLEKLKQYNLDSDQLMNIWEVYDLYCEDREKVPWFKEWKKRDS